MRLRPFAAATPLVLLLATSGFAADPPAKSAPANQNELFGLTKVWTAHLQLTAEAWETMQPKRGPQFGFPGPGGKPPGPGGKPPPKDAPKAPGAFGFDFAYVRGTLDFEGQTY